MRSPDQLVKDLFLSPASTLVPDYRFTIRDLARKFGVSLRTLRFYEDKGVLRPRRLGPARLYAIRDSQAMELVQLAKRAGLTLREIRDLLGWSNLDGRVPKPARALALLTGQRDDLLEEGEALEQTVQDLDLALAALAGAPQPEQQAA